MSILSDRKAFSIPWKDLDRWIVPMRYLLNIELPSGWSFVRLGELVDQVEVRVKVEDDEEYDLLGVRWYGDGAFVRETVTGSSSSATYLTPTVPKTFIYNRLFAWKQSFAVLREEHAGCFVSNEFPQFETDESRLLPKYLYLFFTTRVISDIVDHLSVGSTAVSRNRFKEQVFLDLEIPLPPLPVQRVIVRRHQEARAEVRTLRERAEAVERDAPSAVLEQLGIERRGNVQLPKCFALPWEQIEGRLSVNVLARVAAGVSDFKAGDWPTEPLGTLCKGRSGSTPRKRTARFWGGDVPWVSPKDMKVLEVTDTEDHITSEALEEGEAPLIPARSILIVVRSGILQRLVPVAINCVPVSINQDMRAFSVQDDRVLPVFLAVYLRAKQHDLLRLVKSSTTVQSINREWLEDYPIPLPPLEVQQEIVARAQDKRREAARLQAEAHRKQQEARKETEALILGTETLAAEARL